MRIAGFDIPDRKRIEASLTYIYGVGSVNVNDLLVKAKVDPDTRTKDLSKDEVAHLQKALESVPTGGNLRRMIMEDIKRLKDIGCYRGLRHEAGLPARGQRTRSNARTRRGRKQTVGAMRKDIAQRMTKTAKTKKEKPEKKHGS